MFQQIKNTLGQKDGQYQLKTIVQAIIKQVKQVEYSQSSGKPKQGLLLESGGEESWVTLIGKFDALDNNYVGKTYEFSVWPYKNPQSPQTTLYCWINRQINPQSPSQPPQSTNSQAGDDRNASICRQCAGKCAAEIASGKDFATAMDALTYVIDLAVPLSKWFLTGNLPKLFTPDPNQSGYGVPDTEEDNNPEY